MRRIGSGYGAARRGGLKGVVVAGRSRTVAGAACLSVFLAVASVVLSDAPGPARATGHSVTWTTRSDFLSNAVSVGTSTTTWQVEVDGDDTPGDANDNDSVRLERIEEGRTLAGGVAHSLAVQENGSVWSAGANGSGQLGVSDETSRTWWSRTDLPWYAVSVAAGNGHSVAVNDDGRVWVTGENGAGQLGLGSTTDWSDWIASAETPTQTAAVACGYEHSLLLKRDGRVLVTGNNDHGQLGLGDTAVRTVWTETTLTAVAAIGAGSHYSLAVLEDGTLLTVGQNDDGQLGLNDTSERHGWTETTLTAVRAVAGGVAHTLALKEDGTVWGTGDNQEWNLGITDQVDRHAFVKLPPEGIVDISAGARHSLALDATGTLHGCGAGGYGQLGLGDLFSLSDWQPVLDDVGAMAAGDDYSLAMRTGGDLWVTGRNHEGQLGRGDKQQVDAWSPGFVGGVVQVASGVYHSLVRKSDQTVWCTGDASYGQLGIGSVDGSVAWRPSNIATVTAIAAGDYHSLAVRGGDTLTVCGSNGSGRIGLGATGQVTSWTDTTLTAVTGVSGGQAHSLAVRSDQSLWATGRNSNGELGLGDTVNRTHWTETTVTGVRMAVAGSAHSVALKWDGTVWVTGDNSYGQLGLDEVGGKSGWVQTTMTAVSEVAAGAWYSMARGSGNVVYVAGANNEGQLGTGDWSQAYAWTSTTMTANWIAARGDHGLAVRSDGRIWVVGRNGDGELGLGDTGQRVWWTPTQLVTDAFTGGSIAGGNYQSIAATSGRVWVTGANSAGQLGLGDSESRETWTAAGLSGIRGLHGYRSPGQIGYEAGAKVGLRVDTDPADQGARARFSVLSFNHDALMGHNEVRFTVRSADTTTALASAKYLGPSGVGSYWTTSTPGATTTVEANGTRTTSFPLYGNPSYPGQRIPAGRYAEVKVHLESDGATSPVVRSVTLEYDTLDPSPTDDLAQARADGAALPDAGWTNETSVALSVADVQGLSDSTTLSACFEVKRAEELWSGSAIVTAAGVSPGATSTAVITVPDGDEAYAWRARLVDDLGRVSQWVKHGTGTSFNVEQVPPTDPTLGSPTHTTGTPSNVRTVVVTMTGATDASSGVAGFSMSWSQDTTELPDTVKDLEQDATSTASGPLAEGTWWFDLRTVDVAGNWSSTSHLGPFLIDTTPPGPPASLAAVAGSREVALTWVNPTADFTATRLLRSSAGHATSPTDTVGQTQVYEGSGTAHADAGLPNGVTYRYTAFSRDEAGNWSVAVQATATPTWTGTSLSCTCSAGTVDYGSTPTITGELFDANGEEVSGPDPIVKLYMSTGHNAASPTYLYVGDAAWDPGAGTYRATTPGLVCNTAFHLELSGDATYSASTSRNVLVLSRALFYRPSMNTYVPYRNRYFTVYGCFRPGHSGKTTVEFYRKVGSRWVPYRWRDATNRKLSVNLTKYWLGYKLPYRGYWRIRARHWDAGHARTYSTWRVFRVR